MPQLYIWPDGTQGHNRPVDGQVFYTFDTKGNPNGIWQWDNYWEHWVDITNQQNHVTNKSQNNNSGWYSWNPGKENSGHGTYKRVGDTVEVKILKCECGSEKTGSNKHSSWCPKHGN